MDGLDVQNLGALGLLAALVLGIARTGLARFDRLVESVERMRAQMLALSLLLTKDTPGARALLEDAARTVNGKVER